VTQADADTRQPFGPRLLIGVADQGSSKICPRQRGSFNEQQARIRWGIGGPVKAISLIDSADGHGTRRRQSQPVTRG